MASTIHRDKSGAHSPDDSRDDSGFDSRDDSGDKTERKILMVCLGNICRSPLAEGILQRKAKEAGLNWQVDSAGTNGYHTGEAPHSLSQKVARFNGLDISGQRSRKFTAADFDRYDKIYAMAGDVVQEMRRIAGRQFDPTKVDLLMNELHPGTDRDVPDPWSGPEEDYHEVYEMIEAASERIVEEHLLYRSNKNERHY